LPCRNPYQWFYLKKYICFSASPEKTASEVLDFIQHKIKAKNITVEKFNFTYARHTLPFKISVQIKLFSTICSAGYWPTPIVVKGFETRNKNTRKRKRPVVVMLTLPSLLRSFNWNVPCRTVRRFRLLSLPICRSYYALHDPFAFFVTTIRHCVRSYCLIALMQLIIISLCIFYLPIICKFLCY